VQAGLDPKSAEFDLAPYYSLDDAIVAQRARQLLHPPEGVTLSENHGELRVEGTASPQWISRVQERAPYIAGVTSVDTSRLQNSHLLQLNAPKSAIESAILVFPIGRAELEPGQENAIAQTGKQIRDIVAQASRLGEQTTVELTGHTDTTGIEGTNMLLSQERADAIRGILIRGGAQAANLRTRGVGTTQPLRPEDTEENRRLNRSVTFRITFTPVSSGN
jgi:outer membrane protein OmpA-like peptidoglycan-associated protein